MSSTPIDPQKGGSQPEGEDPSKAWLSPSSSDSNTTTPSSQSQQHQQPPKRPRISEAVETIKPADFLKVHQSPCGREGLMTGIAGGVGMMGIRWMAGSPVMKAANWGVGMFVGASMIGWEYCRWQRLKEFEKMKRVVEVYDQRQAEKAREKKQKEEEQAARRRLEEEEAAKRKSSWKFW